MPEGSSGPFHDVPMDEGGLSHYVLVRYFVKQAQEGLESPRLSTASIGSNERAPSTTPSDCSELPSVDQRPVSLVSTLSSGSTSSRDDCQAPPPSGTSSPAPSGEDIDLELNLTGSSGEPGTGDPEEKASGLNSAWSLQQSNASSPNRTAFRRQTTTSPFKAKTMAPNPQLSYLDRVVMEIIETERMYVRDLRMIVEDYLAHIIDHADLSVGPELVCALFGNIEDIYEFNSELLQSLDQCDNDPVAIARCFVMKREYFDIYTQYCTNYPNSVAALTECMRNKSLAKFFRERQASLKRALPLGSYLLKPVQRILKYHLLLQEIAKHSDQQGADYEVVEEAIFTMTGVAWYINDMKRRHEHAVRLQEVQSLLLHWKGPDLTTYGELVLEGTFKVHRAKNERTLFLFDRMLLITKRRGDHFVYKNQISCSTLMLIESAKDSLSFSVAHYKHLKQPHTVQARNLEEKKLWSHHIKRIILENHHAIIPQKAKEAILEMDSIYPSKYRYSPDRLKKALSVQSEELLQEGRQGRRQSEPTKQIFKSSRAIQKSVSSSSDLGSCLRGRGSQRPKEGTKVETEEEQGGRRVSAEHLSCSDPEDVEAGVLQSQHASCLQGQDSDSDDMVIEDYQEEDVRSDAQEDLEHAAAVEKLASVDKSSQNKTADFEQTDSKQTGLDSSPKISDCLRGPKVPANEVENTEETSSAAVDSDSKTLSSEESSEEEDEEENKRADKESRATSILPLSVLSRAGAIAEHFTNSTRRDSVAAADDARSPSCPSPRLLSRTGSTLSLGAEPNERPLRHNSSCLEAPEIFGSTDLTMLSPREDSLFDGGRGARQRRDSTLSMQDQLLIGKIKSYYENAESQDPAFCLRRRESLTSIPTGLVRSSVSRFNCFPTETRSTESAQMKPPPSAAALAAREPDSGCPQGHVMSRASSDPLEWKQVSDGQQHSKVNEGGSLTSSNVKSTAPVATPSSLQEKHGEDEEFRPSSEMIQIWQAMEQDLTSTKVRVPGNPPQTPRGSRAAGSALTQSLMPSQISEGENGGADLSTITEESSSPSPVKHRAAGLNLAGSLKDTLRLWKEGPLQGAPRALRAPRVAELRAQAHEEPRLQEKASPDDLDNAKSKVLHLARQYSQRIKTSKPTVRQQIQDSRFGKRILPSVLEEKESAGKPNLSLLTSHNNLRTTQLRPVEQAGAQIPDPNSGSVSRTCSRSPVSPSSGEAFCWPDVRELRSKYVLSESSQAQLALVGRSQSVPDRMLDGGNQRRSSCSSTLVHPEESYSEVPSSTPQQEGSGTRLQRTKSLDHRLSGPQLNQLQTLPEISPNGGFHGYYISAEAHLPSDQSRKIIVMEKLPEADPVEPVEETIEEEEGENFVQIRSPTSREKISIMAVIDRCRAYQESEEYKQREESGAKMEASLCGGRGKEPDKTTLLSNECEVLETCSGQKTDASHQGVVKNLREKFQNLR